MYGVHDIWVTLFKINQEQLRNISSTSFGPLPACRALGTLRSGLFLKTTLLTSTVCTHLSLGKRKERGLFQFKGFILMWMCPSSLGYFELRRHAMLWFCWCWKCIAKKSKWMPECHLLRKVMIAELHTPFLAVDRACVKNTLLWVLLPCGTNQGRRLPVWQHGDIMNVNNTIAVSMNLLHLGMHLWI